MVFGNFQWLILLAAHYDFKCIEFALFRIHISFKEVLTILRVRLLKLAVLPEDLLDLWPELILNLTRVLENLFPDNFVSEAIDYPGTRESLLQLITNWGCYLSFCLGQGIALTYCFIFFRLDLVRAVP